ncbi:hypothetical protein A7982_12255 [Minicystis rosea]|nr:hypothetical protein A7982_12255 [Minicystis rosea]
MMAAVIDRYLARRLDRRAASCLDVACGRAIAVALAATSLASAPSAFGQTSTAGQPPATAQTPSGAVEAPSGKPRQVAVYVEGKDVEMVTGDLVASIPSAVHVVNVDAFAEALTKAGQRSAFGQALAQPKQRGRALAKIRKAGGSVGADAVIVARVRHDSGAIKVRLLWVDASDEPALDDEVTLAGDDHARRELFAQKLNAPMQKLLPSKPEVAAPPPPPRAAPPPPPPPSRPANEVGTAIIIAHVGATVRGRWFGYNDGSSLNLVPYSGFPAPGPTVGVEVYPVASARIPIVSDLGLTFSYERAFAPKPTSAELEGSSATWDSLRAGLRYRLRVDDLPFQPRPDKVADSTMFGLEGGVGYERFAFATAKGGEVKDAPDVSYLYLHIGVDGRFPISRVAVTVHGSWLGALSSGATYARFRDASLGGLEVGGGLAVKIAAGFEIRASADYTRFFATFAPKFADPYIAGGAVDEMLKLRMGLAYAY